MRIIAAVLALFLTACAGTPFEWENAKAIRVGSTQAELVALLGKPYMVKSQAGQEVWIWSYSGLDGTKLVSYGLKDGLVTTVPIIIN
jgi:outer membrane protein assembly factor BamE (lipoprotein component of BamABCDE complex)